MIRNEQDFALDLDEADRLHDREPAVGTPEHEAFLRLLGRLAGYRPHILAPAVGPDAKAREGLAARLRAFEAKIAPSYSQHWQPMIGGDLRPHADRNAG
ncbi:hypothetical protein [Phenylobacterium sp.]|uniref:hypothetical protein n=1 Tax=Phenylobacterium sp. TaxID=1871053 RepID=UPI0025FEDED8|nr:hypothetical protein [Phenylobacterium sp.]